MDMHTVMAWILSGRSRLVAAGCLFLLVWAIKTMPYVQRKVLTTKARKRAAVVALAAVGAVALAIAGGQSGEQIFDTFVMAIIGATGIHKLVKRGSGQADAAPAPPEQANNDKGEQT